MSRSFGAFSENGRAFRIHTPDIPRNWYNYFYTDHYMTYTSQAGAGEGFLQDEMGRRYSPVCGRGVYIHDGEQGWNLCGLPTWEPYDFYECIHDIGYTVITLEKHGIRTEYGMFVPCEETPTTGYEILWVKATNLSDDKKSLKIMAYADNTVDSAYKPQGYNTLAVDKDPEVNGIHHPKTVVWNGEERSFEIFVTVGQTLSGYDCAKNAFIGPYGSLADPLAIHRGGCTGSACVAEKFGFAVQTTLTLKPGETGFASFAMGMTEHVERINQLTQGISNEQKVMTLLDTMKEKYARICDGLTIQTPYEELDALYNSWLKYQTNMGSRWARVRHNGYRDIASDTECLSAFNPQLAWERIKRLLSYQYASGYAPRTVLDGKLQDKNFSDCTVWLTFTVYAIIQELGKPELLEETVPFCDGEMASVYEHLRRSVDFLYHFKGNHGLIKIWGGDWNDCMDKAGMGQKGVSIWLTMAWYRANRQFAELSALLGKTEEVALAEERGREMKELVDRYGWSEEGGYYLYAISDEGFPIGAPSCEEGKIFLNPQLWAVLSGIAEEGKEITAIDRAESLLSYDLGTAVSTPAYTKFVPYVGSMTKKSPGVQENGGVYLHAMCWKLAVDSLLGRADRVQWDLDRILPFKNPVVDGRAEPYAICNCYMGKETGYRYGTPGQSWRTASAQWLLYAVARFMFGLTPTMEGLEIHPCLPEDWNEAKVTRRFRGCTYVIEYKRTGKQTLTVDGTEQAYGSPLPQKNGKTYRITVTV